MKTSKSRPRITATRVIPHFSALRTARAVGAETAAMIGAPRGRPSEPARRRRGSSSAPPPQAGDSDAPARPRACRAHCGGRRPRGRSARRIRAPEGRRMDGARLLIDVCSAGSGHRVDRPRRDRRIFQHRQRARRRLQALDPAQAAAGGPAMCAPPLRHRPPARSAPSHVRASTPSPVATISYRRSHPTGRSTIPSVRAKPTAKSSRSPASPSSPHGSIRHR